MQPIEFSSCVLLSIESLKGGCAVLQLSWNTNDIKLKKKLWKSFVLKNEPEVG